MIDLKAKPFNLNDEQIKWVKTTIDGMTVEEKIGQLFCVMGMVDGKKGIEHLVRDIHIGGIMYRPAPSKALIEVYNQLQYGSKVPLLLAANLESGGKGGVIDGTMYANPLGVAATNDPRNGYRLGKISCGEGAAVGMNWAFAPIVDIDMNFRNPITNLRTFGSKVENVINFASGYLKAAKEENVCVSIKHFPGDGVDERDQHLVTSINSLSAKEWDDTYGKVYGTLIDQGAETVMIGHIAQPAYVKQINAKATVEEQYMPASLNKYILNGLLREKLNFNGLIVTDATTMLGFTVAMPRQLAVPTSIANGCDMFLFTKNVDEDYKFMLDGYKNGIISDERLSDALYRILATKAAKNLHIKHKEHTIVPTLSEAQAKLRKPEYLEWVKECADQSVTLVKDTQHLLPLSPAKHKRIYLHVLETNPAKKSEYAKNIIARLEKEGFVVTYRSSVLPNLGLLMKGIITPAAINMLKELGMKTAELKGQYDLAFFIANFETASNNTVIRINWRSVLGMGNGAPWYVAEIPALFISTANPYHLLDAPMFKTFINTYSNNSETLDQLFDKLMGRSTFKGVSPVDPFCGREDTKF